MDIKLYYELRDDRGDDSYHSVRVERSSWTVAQAQAYSDVYAAAYDTAAGSQIVGASAVFSLTLPTGLKSAPALLSDNSRGGLLSFETDMLNLSSFRLPAISDSLVLADTTLDTSAAALISFVDLYETGVTVDGEIVRIQDDFGEEYETLQAAALSFRQQSGLETTPDSPADLPLMSVAFSPSWRPYVLAMLDKLRYESAWDGTPGDVEQAQQDAEELIYIIAAVAVPEGVFSLGASELGTGILA